MVRRGSVILCAWLLLAGAGWAGAAEGGVGVRADRPADLAVGQPFDQQVDHQIDQQIAQPADQPADQSIDQPAARPLEAPVFRDVERVPRGALAAREVDVLIDSVVALNENHGWRWSEAGALIASLEEAFLDLDRAQFAKAARQLTDFSDRIAAYVNDGSIPRDAGVPLLDAAGAILGRIDALERSERLAGPADGPAPDWAGAAPHAGGPAGPAETP